jgi:hypothetical protein
MTKEAKEANRVLNEDSVNGSDDFADVWDNIPRGQPGPFTIHENGNFGHAVCSGSFSLEELVADLD